MGPVRHAGAGSMLPGLIGLLAAAAGAVILLARRRGE
ncbi:LPXTG cell wall anchor domain-containing protein [Nigerium sp.]